MRRVLLCGSPMYEGISSPTNHSHSDRQLHEGMNFVTIILCIRIRINGSNPILILCCRFVVAFVIRIRITHSAEVESQLKGCITIRGAPTKPGEAAHGKPGMMNACDTAHAFIFICKQAFRSPCLEESLDCTMSMCRRAFRLSCWCLEEPLDCTWQMCRRAFRLSCWCLEKPLDCIMSMCRRDFRLSCWCVDGPLDLPCRCVDGPFDYHVGVQKNLQTVPCRCEDGP